MIKFERIQVQDTLDVLKNHCASRSAVDIVERVFEHGGYVAGGFATVFVRELLSETHGLPSYGMHLTIARQLNKGDMDVWFCNNEQLYSFRTDPKIIDLHVPNKQSVAGWATDYYAAGVKIQVITKRVVPIEQQLSGFDIYNSMVAFDRNTCTFPENWLKLEKEKTLHVNNVQTYTPNRVMKYLYRKCYERVTPTTASMFKDMVLELAEKQRENSSKKQNFIERMMHMNLTNKTGALMRILPSMSTKDLLLISAMFGHADKHDYAMEELYVRSKNNNFQAR